MIKLDIKYDDDVYEVEFEHCLRSMSKWESKYCKPFIVKFAHPPLEMLYYFECMIMTPDVDRNLVYALTPDQMDEITEYINNPQTATKVPELRTSGKSEQVTSELIYYWLVAMKINWEVQDWPLNRLMKLIEITNYKNQPEKDRKQKVNLQDWRDANERQKAMFKTKG